LRRIRTIPANDVEPILSRRTVNDRLLRKHGGKTGEELKAERALFNAARNGDINTVRRHLDAGTDVNAKDDRGMTPLHWAGSNTSKRTRQSLTLVFFSESAQRDKEAFGRYQDSVNQQHGENGIR
jgi:hypothetical protein